MSYLLSVRRRSMVPEGLIIAFDDTSIPTDWERFTDADSKHIIGAGDTYAVAATGGSHISVSKASATGGAHTGATEATDFVNTEGSDTLAGGHYSIAAAGSESAGGHTHTVSFTYQREYQQILLIRSTKNQTQFPTNAVIFGSTGSSPVTGLNIVYDDNLILRSGASIATGGGTFDSQALTSSDNHDHETTSQYYDNTATTSAPATYRTGAHNDHSITPSIDTETLKRTYLAAWKGSSEFSGAPGIIAMWEGATAPPGWKLCDGTNGTLNLQDYFLMFGDVGTAGDQYDEANAIDISITLGNSSNEHHHATTDYDCNSTTSGYHGLYENTHTHTVANHTGAYVPPYYALTFIQKA